MLDRIGHEFLRLELRLVQLLAPLPKLAPLPRLALLPKLAQLPKQTPFLNLALLPRLYPVLPLQHPRQPQFPQLDFREFKRLHKGSTIKLKRNA